VLPVPKASLDAYLDMSRACAAVWMEFGALEYVECVEDDVKPGQWTSFPQAVDLKDGEVVVFSWIKYPDRATRDACNAKVMEDPRIAAYGPENMPMDGKRMIFGGFVPAIALSA
jgi:uncharacterized protein YbaA (DUF1428 family)